MMGRPNRSISIFSMVLGKPVAKICVLTIHPMVASKITKA
jgi:hypothetical protein